MSPLLCAWSGVSEVGSMSMLQSISLISLTDPAYKKAIPNLDGMEGCSEHIHFGADLSGFESKRPQSKL